MALGQTIGRNTGSLKEERQAWRTPPDIFAILDSVFHFTIDACASVDNALCKRFWTSQDDAAKQDWTGEIVFCNPPFSLAGKMLPKARQARQACFLLPTTALTSRYFATSLPDVLLLPPYRIKFVPPLDVTSQQPSLGTAILLYNPGKIECLAKHWAAFILN